MDKRLCIVLYLVVLLCFVIKLTSANCNETFCIRGKCKDNYCVCNEGWKGPQCQHCGDKIRLTAPTGTIVHGFGNYPFDSRCTWLIESSNNTPITLHFDDFETEKGWDYLYVYDGDSTDAPLLGAFSGLSDLNLLTIPEVVAHSGAALVHFYSDAAGSSTGFNITYRTNACPSAISGKDCSENGVCEKGTCSCSLGWKGEACHIEICPNNCGSEFNRGICVQSVGCACHGEYRGSDCSQTASDGYWESVDVKGPVPPGSASSSAVVWKNFMYIIGGESFDNKKSFMYQYDFKGNNWTTIIAKSPTPAQRFGHSTVIYDDKIYMYGGTVNKRIPTSELLEFNVVRESWKTVSIKNATCIESSLMCGPLELTGHTATVVKGRTTDTDKMVVIFGHSTKYGFMNIVQEYYFNTREWLIPETKGYLVKGCYGHSASWDPLTEKIYVFGGLDYSSDTTDLYSYEPIKRIWTRLFAVFPDTKFLHTGTFISGGTMMIFGGSTILNTSVIPEFKRMSNKSKINYSSEVFIYDTFCDSWHTLSIPELLVANVGRFGHTAVTFVDSIYIYGGFDGQMLSNMFKFTPGDCTKFNGYVHFKNYELCLGAHIGDKCVWADWGKCYKASELGKKIVIDHDSVQKCPRQGYHTDLEVLKNATCNSIKQCSNCLHTSNECVWCNDSCSYKGCTSNYELNDKRITNLDQCATDIAFICGQFHSCYACTSQPLCGWSNEAEKCVEVNDTNITISATGPSQCSLSCSEYSSCSNCISDECIWCHNEQLCLDNKGNTYRSSFPYGECRDYITFQSGCPDVNTLHGDGDSQCGFYNACAKCREDPACGWCDDGSGTGVGRCLSGGYSGPRQGNKQQLSTSNSCPRENWHFTTCPSCQCNGHASCLVNTTTCGTCKDFSTGTQCETCQTGYWGDPVNNGKCQECDCGTLADDCDKTTGNCKCKIKGMIGNRCEKCDIHNNYTSVPFKNDSCYYKLATNYQYTFNLSKDPQYTQIQYIYSQTEPDVDLNFTVVCSVPAKFNVTIRHEDSPEEEEEEIVATNEDCNILPKTVIFHTSDCKKNNTNMKHPTVQVHVFQLHSPMWIQVSFSQCLKDKLENIVSRFMQKWLQKYQQVPE